MKLQACGNVYYGINQGQQVTGFSSKLHNVKNWEQIDKIEYVDMVVRMESYIRANRMLPAIVYRKSTLPDYNDSTMKLFVKTFSFKGNSIDEALAVISKVRLYLKYFDSQKTDKKTINDAVMVNALTALTGGRPIIALQNHWAMKCSSSM